MAALGLHDAQIGMVASFGLAMQFIWGLFSGAIADKYGRRRMLLVFSLLSWTIPCGIWAIAQGYWYFLIAVFFNSMWRVTGNCFSCLIVEDGDQHQFINIFTILNLCGLLAGFIAPISGLFIDRFTLIPTMRVLYILAMVLMTVKFLVLNRLSNDSEIGKQRILKCRNKSVLSLTFGGWRIFIGVLKQPRVLLGMILMTLMTCFNTIQITFWPLFVTSEYGVSDSMFSIFPLVKTVTTILVYLLITPRLNIHSVRRPLLVGLGSHALGLTALLVCMQLGVGVIWVVFFSAICEAFAMAMLGPLSESLMSVSIQAEERARTNSLIFAVILLVSTPAGWIAGQLSQQSRTLPLVLNLCIIAAEGVVALCISRYFYKESTAINRKS